MNTLKLLVLCFGLTALFNLPACYYEQPKDGHTSDNRCPYEGAECPNAQAAMLEYQIRLETDGSYIYDGNRLVGVLAFDSTQAFDKLMINDNE